MNTLSSFHFRTGDLAKTNDIGRLLRIPIFFFLGLFFYYVGQHRLIDGDEGYYLEASRLVMEQKIPYLDFFFPQTPLLPYAYGLWMKLFGMTWYSARSCSAALTTILGMFIYEHIYRETHKWFAGLAAVILFASSVYIFAWYPIAKTYSLSGLLLFAVYVILAQLNQSSSLWLIVVAGVLFGLSVDARLFMAGLAPLFIWWVLQKSNRSDRILRLLCFVGALSISVSPLLYLFFAHYKIFIFNNIGFHALRSNDGLVGNFWQKIKTVALIFVNGHLRFGENGIQLIILLSFSLAVNFPPRKAKNANVLALLIALALGLISLLPTPTWIQYFCITVPYLIVASVCPTADWMYSLRSGPRRRMAALAGLAVLLIFVASGSPSFRRYLFTGQDVMGVFTAAAAPNWTLENASAVSQAIDGLATPKEKIAGFWPGYTFASYADPYPGFEDDFARQVSSKLTLDQVRNYHNITRGIIEAAIVAHAFRLAVVGNQLVDDGARAKYEQLLRANGYTEAQKIGDASIYALSALK